MAEALICLGVLAGMIELSRRNLRTAVSVLSALLPIYLIRASVPLPLIGRLPTTALEMAVLAIFGVWLWKRGRDYDSWRPALKWLGPVSLFVGGAVVGTLVSPDLRAALGILRAYFIEPVLMFIVMLDLIRTRKEANGILTGLAVSTIVIGLYATFQKITGHGIPNPVWQMAETRRVTAFFGYPNAIGLLAAPLAVLFFGQAKQLIEDKQPRAALLPSAASFLGVLGLVFAVSQGAMLGAACGLFLLGITDKKLRLPTLALTAIALAAIIGLAPLREKAVSLVSLADDSGSVRMIIWGETMNMLADRPVLGAGLAGYQHWYAPYHEAKHIEIFMYPHSLLLNFWTEIGIAGTLGFLWVIARFIRIAVAAWRKDGFWVAGAAVCAMTALLIHGLVDVPYFKNDLAILFWIIVALGSIPNDASNHKNASGDR